MTAVAVLGVVAQVPAGPFVVGTWSGSLEGRMDYSRQDVETGNVDGGEFENLRLEERLTLRNVGTYLYDPRLLSLSASGTFGLSQLDFTSPGESATDNGTLTGYDVAASILSSKPFSLELFANRFQLFPPLVGGRSELVTEDRGARLLASNLYIPSFLSYRQTQSTQESTTSGVVSRQERIRDNIRYEGQRGWNNSEVELLYEFIDETDEVVSDLSYESHEGNLNYSLDFGQDLNWHWDSRLRHFERTGSSDLTTSTADELLRIDHRDNLGSDLRYAFTRTETPSGTNSTHSGSALLRHELYESLTTVAELNGRFQRLPEGAVDTYTGRVNVGYRKRLPGDGRLLIGLEGGLQYQDQRFDAAEGLVLQETLTAATPFALPLRLENPFVVEATVVVTKIATGPLPAGCIAPPGPPTPLIVGRDYRLRDVGDSTEVVPIACDGLTPGINPGDTIAVDYSFATPGDLAVSALNWRTDVSVDYGWIRPFFSHEQANQNLVSGTDGQFLNDRQSDTLGVELSHQVERLRGAVVAEANRYRSDRLTFDSVRAAQQLSVRLSRRLDLNVNGEQSRTEFEDPTRTSDTFAGRARLSYTVNANVVTELSSGLRVLEDTLYPREQVGEVALRSRLQWRRLEVLPALEWFDRERGDTTTQEIRVTLSVIRRL